MDISTSAYDYIYDPGAYALVAGMGYGSDGASSGASELWGGDSFGGNDGRKSWDNLTDGSVDSGWVGIGLTSSSGSSSSLNFAVAGSSTGALSYSAGSLGSFSTVEIQAGLTTSGTISWRNLSISFYHDNTLLDIYTSSSGPSVFNSDGHLSAGEAVLDVTTSYSGVNHIVFAGEMRMTAPTGTYPDAMALFAQILIS